jgi:pyruvate ferredoxin oxidoreductase gamma subunit
MFEIRLHGRGGQGVVTAAELLSVAAFDEGRYAQATPSFGSERMGAPVVSFCRIDDQAIRLREPILEPDAVIIQDPTLLHSIDVFSGLNPQGYILINSTRSFEELGIAEFAARRSRTPPCWAVSRQSPSCSPSTRWQRRSAKSFRARLAKPMSPLPAKPMK